MALPSPLLPRCFATAPTGAAVCFVLLTGCAASQAPEDESQTQQATMARERDAQVSAPDGEETSGEDRYCTLAGCWSNLTIQAPLPDTTEAIRALSLEVCLNGACHAVEFATISEHQSLGGLRAFVPYDASNSIETTVWLTVSRESERYVLKASWTLPNATKLQDGDHYRVTLRDASGQPWRTVETSVTYWWTYPNGEACPPGCRRAEINLLNAVP